MPAAHVDLRFLMARLGFKGGLEKIEPRFGIRRPKAVNGMDGYMAVLLWQRYQRGDKAPWNCSSPTTGKTWSTWKCSWTRPFGWSGSGSSPPARGRAACTRRPGLKSQLRKRHGGNAPPSILQKTNGGHGGSPHGKALVGRPSLAATLFAVRKLR